MEQPFLEAAQTGHFEMVEHLLQEKPALVEATDEAGMTALHLAASHGQDETVRLLLNAGANVNAEVPSFETLLSLVRQPSTVRLLLQAGLTLPNFEEWAQFDFDQPGSPEGHVYRFSATQILLDAGVDPFIRDENGSTLLHFAAQCGDADGVQSLLAKGVNVDAINYLGTTPLHQAAWSFHGAKVIASLVQVGANINSTDALGRNALWYAGGRSIGGNIPSLEVLLRAGADTEIRYAHDETLLLTVLRYTNDWDGERYDRRYNVVKALLGADTSVNVQDDEGNTPLHWISRIDDFIDDDGLDRFNLAGSIFQQTKDVSAANKNGETPLSLALARDNLQLIQLLTQPFFAAVEVGDIDTVRQYIESYQQLLTTENSESNNALLVATGHGRAEVTAFLVEAGACVNSYNNLSHSPLHYAAGSGQVHIARMLLAKGADVNAEDGDHWTPLHWVTFYGGGLEIAKILVAHGADVNHLGDGSTPLNYADHNKDTEVADFLYEAGAA